MNECLKCSTVAKNFNLCNKCNEKESYYPKENDPLNIGDYFKCYQKPEGYYLDIKDHLYKKCYERCLTCDIKGDELIHNCMKCNSNYSFQILLKNSNYSNCYENCSYFHFFDENNKYHCTNDSSCPGEYPKLIKDELECVKSCSEH